MTTYVTKIIIPIIMDGFFDISKFRTLLMYDEKLGSLFFLYKKPSDRRIMLLVTNKIALFPISNTSYLSVEICPNSCKINAGNITERRLIPTKNNAKRNTRFNENDMNIGS